MELLQTRERLTGAEVAAVIEKHGHPDDLKARDEAKSGALM